MERLVGARPGKSKPGGMGLAGGPLEGPLWAQLGDLNPGGDKGHTEIRGGYHTFRRGGGGEKTFTGRRVKIHEGGAPGFFVGWPGG